MQWLECEQVPHNDGLVSRQHERRRGLRGKGHVPHILAKLRLQTLQQLHLQHSKRQRPRGARAQGLEKHQSARFLTLATEWIEYIEYIDPICLPLLPGITPHCSASASEIAIPNQKSLPLFEDFDELIQVAHLEWVPEREVAAVRHGEQRPVVAEGDTTRRLRAEGHARHARPRHGRTVLLPAF